MSSWCHLLESVDDYNLSERLFGSLWDELTSKGKKLKWLVLAIFTSFWNELHRINFHDGVKYGEFYFAMLLKFLEEHAEDRKAFYSKYFLSMQCRRQLQLCWICSAWGTMIYGKHLSVPFLRILKKLCFSYTYNKLTIHSTVKLCNIHNIWETKDMLGQNVVVTLSNEKSVCSFASRLSRIVSLVRLDWSSLTN